MQRTERFSLANRYIGDVCRSKPLFGEQVHNGVHPRIDLFELTTTVFELASVATAPRAPNTPAKAAHRPDRAPFTPSLLEERSKR